MDRKSTELIQERCRHHHKKHNITKKILFMHRIQMPKGKSSGIHQNKWRPTTSHWQRTQSMENRTTQNSKMSRRGHPRHKSSKKKHRRRTTTSHRQRLQSREDGTGQDSKTHRRDHPRNKNRNIQYNNINTIILILSYYNGIFSLFIIIILYNQ